MLCMFTFLHGRHNARDSAREPGIRLTCVHGPSPLCMKQTSPDFYADILHVGVTRQPSMPI